MKNIQKQEMILQQNVYQDYQVFLQWYTQSLIWQKFKTNLQMGTQVQRKMYRLVCLLYVCEKKSLKLEGTHPYMTCILLVVSFDIITRSKKCQDNPLHQHPHKESNYHPLLKKRIFRTGVVPASASCSQKQLFIGVKHVRPIKTHFQRWVML